MRRLLCDPRLRWLAAGILYGYLLLAVVLSVLACKTIGPAAGASTWSLLQPGTTTVYTSCSAVVVEVRQAHPDAAFFWRVSVIPRPITKPPRPEPETQASLELRR